ncbi:DNA-3-methyladenine glycosylase I [Tuanshanicoccus lijuaniae]|uniref:DNA-3-methyladenine glycosylase I n=1 Tax=Aerococcaceae bacterium zg-1292 TaxID=2774330 RepID=UPI001BD85C5A|nr:DNA-3-methyladenine glycosylase I [Aerococcaceae bacterium zg-BR22]MBS4456136.1 DNA-3-methyladenine glycosylase I [Aerococcaceae bacterium zg-A91]MBS4457987.1 DNA-3-methyladenine glycosylase I [Aerococcaceae bacterium zg-BR33]
MTKRCQWVEGKPDYYIAYHDHVWGKPEHDDSALFRWLILEMFHIGLSWQLVLSKQTHFDEAFDAFDYQKIATYDEQKITALLENKGIIRHRGKIQATITNAQAFMNVQEQYGSFDAFIWSFTNGETIVKAQDVHITQNDLSAQVTKALKRHGFKFLGSVTIYSYLQAIGVVNDHDFDCDFR